MSQKTQPKQWLPPKKTSSSQNAQCFNPSEATVSFWLSTSTSPSRKDLARKRWLTFPNRCHCKTKWIAWGQQECGASPRSMKKISGLHESACLKRIHRAGKLARKRKDDRAVSLKENELTRVKLPQSILRRTWSRVREAEVIQETRGSKDKKIVRQSRTPRAHLAKR